MKAVVFQEHGGPEVLQMVDMPDPIPNAGEVVIRVEAVALNHLDLWVRGGLPGQEVPMPHLLGSEIVGIVEQIGPPLSGSDDEKSDKPVESAEGLYGDRITTGQRVLLAPMTSCRQCEFCLQDLDALCIEGFKIFGYQLQGGYAEKVTMPADVCIPLTREDDPVAWSAVPLTFMTAHHMLFRQAALQAGETVLVHAAGSGVGVAGIQIAKHAGAVVLATASTKEKLDRALELGADEVINYTETDFSEAVHDLTNGRGVDVIFEHVGADIFEKNMKSLARAGRLVTCGATTGADVTVNLRYLFVKQLRIIGSYMGGRQELFEVLEGVRRGDYSPVVDTVFPLEKAAEAHRYLQDRNQFGKVVLTP